VFALTNATATGTVSGVGGAVVWNIDTAAGATLGVIDLDVPGTDVLTLTVDGVPATQPTFEAALTDGDAVTYGRAAGTVTASLTNQAQAAVTGRVLDFDTVLNTVTIDSGPASAVTTTDYTAADFDIFVNNIASLEADLEAALNIGDTVTFQAAATTPATDGSLRLVDGPVSGTPEALVPGVSITISFDANGPASDLIDHTAPTDPMIVNFAGLSNNIAVTYVVNGAASTEAGFEAAVNGVIVGGLTGTVAVSDSGTNTVWTFTP
jgi:hypothetical protein